jgi:TolA-binding protein
MKRLILLLALAASVAAAPPTTCRLEGEYESALCAYQRRDFAAAERGFEALAEKEEQDGEALRARYFLARTQMKTGRFDEASAQLIRIYTLDPRFYDTWNCDFLLGECRKATGK